jgi:hypothetical protein
LPEQLRNDQRMPENQEIGRTFGGLNRPHGPKSGHKARILSFRHTLPTIHRSFALMRDSSAASSMMDFICAKTRRSRTASRSLRMPVLRQMHFSHRFPSQS